MTTHKADYKLIVKELPAPSDGEKQNATWALECAPQTMQLPFISDTGCMYIRFKPDVSEGEAREICRRLNAAVADFTVMV